MTFSYSGDPDSSSLDYVRDQIGDTDEDDPILTDEEINKAISDNSVLLLASANCARKIGARFSRKVTKNISGVMSINYSDLAKQFFALADQLKKQAKMDVRFQGTAPAVERVTDTLVFPERLETGEEKLPGWHDTHAQIIDTGVPHIITNEDVI
jgi:hypothetical protein